MLREFLREFVALNNMTLVRSTLVKLRFVACLIGNMNRGAGGGEGGMPLYFFTISHVRIR